MSVAPERMARWLEGFAALHGAVAVDIAAGTVTLTALDGARAECAVPFPPLDAVAGDPYGGLVGHALAERSVGVLLVRLGGHAAGVFEGSRLMDSKVGSRPVHGRSAAGGWSQKRFARRREGQVQVAVDAAVGVALRVLVPVATSLTAVVLGGDRRALDAVVGDSRLAVLRPLVVDPPLDVPDPGRRVLESTPALFRAVRVRILDPA